MTHVFVPSVEYRQKSTSFGELIVDSTTNNILLTWLLDIVCGEQRNLITAFKCGVSCYKLKIVDQPFETLTASVDVIKSIVTMFSTLSKYRFTHGDPSPHKLRVVGDSKLRLDPGEYSTFSTDKVTIRSKDKKHISSTLSTVPSTTEYYKIHPDTHNTLPFIERRRSGKSLYPCSFDLYCILIGLYCDTDYNNILKSIGWTNLWTVHDLQEIDLRVTQWKQNAKSRFPHFHDIYKIISGLTIKDTIPCV